jgi:hypothetical protein
MIIKSERLKRAILAALSDNELQRIMESAIYQSKSVNQIIFETNISHTSTYRKIKWLVEEKLLIVDKIEITEEGKKSSLFRTVLIVVVYDIQIRKVGIYFLSSGNNMPYYAQFSTLVDVISL